MIRWRLAMRLLARDWRSGELRVLVAALLIAVAASTAIGFFTDRLGRGMANQSADFLGADLVLASPRPVAASGLSRRGRAACSWSRRWNSPVLWSAVKRCCCPA